MSNWVSTEGTKNTTRPSFSSAAAARRVCVGDVTASTRVQPRSRKSRATATASSWVLRMRPTLSTSPRGRRRPPTRAPGGRRAPRGAAPRTRRGEGRGRRPTSSIPFRSRLIASVVGSPSSWTREANTKTASAASIRSRRTSPSASRGVSGVNATRPQRRPGEPPRPRRRAAAASATGAPPARRREEPCSAVPGPGDERGQVQVHDDEAGERARQEPTPSRDA